MIDPRFYRFLAVGALNTLFGYGAYALLIFLGVHYGIAALLATIAGVLFNFRTTGKIVFGSHDHSLLGRFVAVYVLLYLLNLGGLRLLREAGVDSYSAGALLVPPSAILGFLLNRAFVFHRGDGR